MAVVPVIDVSGLRAGDAQGSAAAAAALDHACREVGFFAVSGHGVSPALLDAARTVGRAFFALPDGEKHKIERPPARVSRGWSWVGDRALAYSLGKKTPPDLQQSFAMGPLHDVPTGLPADHPARGMYAPNLWPVNPPDFRPICEAVFAELDVLSRVILQGFAIALGLPRDYFDAVNRHDTSNMRLLHYPAPKGEPLAGQLRAGEHSDYGSLTILDIEDVPGGLEIRGVDRQWRSVRVVPGALVCNIGDMMARWTNDRWNSTLHRVGNPPLGAADRLTIAYFQQPDWDAEITCLDASATPRYPPARFADLYLAKQMAANRKELAQV
jgi:isopenicillin N synthase-like dioxygenase